MTLYYIDIYIKIFKKELEVGMTCSVATINI